MQEKKIGWDFIKRKIGNMLEQQVKIIGRQRSKIFLTGEVKVIRFLFLFFIHK